MAGNNSTSLIQQEIDLAKTGNGILEKILSAVKDLKSVMDKGGGGGGASAGLVAGLVAGLGGGGGGGGEQSGESAGRKVRRAQLQQTRAVQQTAQAATQAARMGLGASSPSYASVSGMGGAMRGLRYQKWNPGVGVGISGPGKPGLGSPPPKPSSWRNASGGSSWRQQWEAWNAQPSKSPFAGLGDRKPKPKERKAPWDVRAGQKISDFLELGGPRKMERDEVGSGWDRFKSFALSKPSVAAVAGVGANLMNNFGTGQIGGNMQVYNASQQAAFAHQSSVFGMVDQFWNQTGGRLTNSRGGISGAAAGIADWISGIMKGGA